MKWFSDLRIRKKLMLSFILISVLCAVMGILSSYNLKSVEKSDTELYENMTVPLVAISKVSTEFDKSGKFPKKCHYCGDT